VGERAALVETLKRVEARADDSRSGALHWMEQSIVAREENRRLKQVRRFFLFHPRIRVACVPSPAHLYSHPTAYVPSHLVLLTETTSGVPVSMIRWMLELRLLRSSLLLSWHAHTFVE
jgi:hypothetical protein